MRVFVTGTDTDVGKTEVSCALLSVLAQRGLKPFAWKPFESGGTGDAERLWDASGRWQAGASVCTYRLETPLAPHMAAQKEGVRVDWRRVTRAFADIGPGPCVVEGAGGLHVPITAKRDVIDFIEELRLPVLLVARAGLGTINHTSLSLNALFERKLKVLGVVLTATSPAKDEAVRLNRAELARRFPRVTFVGPVPFVADAMKRRAAVVRALRPLL
jgi:dethiobiotin synthetase